MLYLILLIQIDSFCSLHKLTENKPTHNQNSKEFCNHYNSTNQFSLKCISFKLTINQTTESARHQASLIREGSFDPSISTVYTGQTEVFTPTH